MKKILVKTLKDWDKIAQMIVPRLKSGTIIALSGPLGAGKTTFVQILARTLGAKVNPRSPTFSLLRTYKLKAKSSKLVRLVHVDAYRIENEKDVRPLNLEEELKEPGTILSIEWPENIKNWLTHQSTPIIHLSIQLQKNNSRLITLRV